MLLRPDLLEPPDRCSRQSAGVLAEQRHQRLLEVAGGDALEVEDRDQHFEALRPPRVGRQKRRRKVNALRTLANTVAHARTAHGHWTDAGHDLALGQIPVSHQPLAPVRGQLVGMGTEQAHNLGLNSLRQQRSVAAAQNIGQRVRKSSWLRKLENVSVGHGVSLLQWRSGGSNTLTIRRLIPSCRHQLSSIAQVVDPAPAVEDRVGSITVYTLWMDLMPLPKTYE